MPVTFCERRGSLTQNCLKKTLCIHASHCGPRPSGILNLVAVFVFVQITSLGKVSSSEVEELQKKNNGWCTSIVKRVVFDNSNYLQLEGGVAFSFTAS